MCLLAIQSGLFVIAFFHVHYTFRHGKRCLDENNSSSLKFQFHLAPSAPIAQTVVVFFPIFYFFLFFVFTCNYVLDIVCRLCIRQNKRTAFFTLIYYTVTYTSFIIYQIPNTKYRTPHTGTTYSIHNIILLLKMSWIGFGNRWFCNKYRGNVSNQRILSKME